MKEQLGIYCDRNEWLGVLIAVNRGLKAYLDEYAQSGNKMPVDVEWAMRGSQVFQERAMAEMGILDGFHDYVRKHPEGREAMAELGIDP